MEKNSQDAEMYKIQKKMRNSKTLIQKYENNEKKEKKKKNVTGTDKERNKKRWEKLIVLQSCRYH